MLCVLAIVVALVLAPRLCGATIVHLVGAPDGVLLGADTKPLAVSGIPGCAASVTSVTLPTCGIIGSDPLCKITQLDDHTACAFSGSMGELATRDGTIFFRLSDTLRADFAHLPLGPNRLAQLEENARAGFEMFCGKMDCGSYIGDLTCAEVRPGYSQVRNARLRVLPGSPPRVEILRSAGHLDDFPEIGTGICADQERISRSHDVYANPTLRLRGLRDLLRKAISAHRTECAAPVDIVRVTAAKGVEWIKRSPACGGR